jgi:hypothetical protein
VRVAGLERPTAPDERLLAEVRGRHAARKLVHRQSLDDGQGTELTSTTMGTSDRHGRPPVTSLNGRPSRCSALSMASSSERKTRLAR